MRGIFLAVLLLTSTQVLAETARIRKVDLNALPTHALHEGEGQVAFLATDEEGLPLVARIVFNEGDEQKPYTVNDGRIRLAFVERGEIVLGEGATIERRNERSYGAGDILVIPAGVPFWVAAREGGENGATLVISIIAGGSTLNTPFSAQ